MKHLSDFVHTLLPCICGGDVEVTYSPASHREYIGCRTCEVELHHRDPIVAVRLWNKMVALEPAKPEEAKPEEQIPNMPLERILASIELMALRGNLIINIGLEHDKQGDGTTRPGATV